MERVKVINSNNSWMGTEYYIGEKKVERVKSVDFHAGVDEVPVFKFETIGIPDIDMLGDVQFKFTPKTVQEAAAVIVKSFSDKQSAEYKAFVDSIYSALKELPKESYMRDVAAAIANRILGLEEN